MWNTSQYVDGRRRTSKLRIPRWRAMGPCGLTAFSLTYICARSTLRSFVHALRSLGWNELSYLPVGLFDGLGELTDL